MPGSRSFDQYLPKVVRRRTCGFALTTSLLVPLLASCAGEVRAPGGTVSVSAFEVSPGWGDVPLHVGFRWEATVPPGVAATCYLDVDIDGEPDVVLESCSAGHREFTYAKRGRFEPALIVRPTVGSEVRATTRVYANELVFAERTIFPEKLPGYSGETVGEASLGLSFDELAHVPEIRVNDILWGTEGEGYLRRVTAVAVSGRDLAVTTGPAYLDEAIKEGFFGMHDVAVVPRGAKCVGDCTDVTITETLDGEGPLRPQTEPPAGKPELHVDVLFPKFAVSTAKGDFGYVRPQMTVGVWIDDFVLDVSLLQPSEFRLDFTPYVNIGANLTLHGQIDGWKREFPLIRLGAIPLGPVILVPDVQPVLEISAKLGAKFQWTTGVRASFPVKIHYSNGKWSEDINPDLQAYSSQEAGLSVELASAEARIGPRFSTKILGVAGPFVLPEAKVDVAVTVNQKLGLCIDAAMGAVVKLGAVLDLFRVIKLYAEIPKTLASRPFYHQCFLDSCSDKVKNGVETDVDCGGGGCDPCGNGKACAKGSDCVSSYCANNVCEPPPASCANGKRDGNESDVDCGGSCGGCAIGKRCNGNTDCSSGNCSGGTCAPQLAPCMNGVRDGNESDVDCGGNCGGCAIGKRCNGNSDCASGNCSGGMCAQPLAPCMNGVRDGNESDVDCGGNCGGCAIGKRCNGNSDCASGNCSGGMCAQPLAPCMNGVRDGNESDVDCGGNCSGCAIGKRCNGNSDCASGNCSGGACAPPAEACDGIDNDGNARIDDVGPLGMDCMLDVWRLQSMASSNDFLLLPSSNYNSAPQPPIGYNPPGSYPPFVVYKINVPGTQKLYSCVKNAAPPDHYYTTDPLDPTCGGAYSAISQNSYVGYVLTKDPGAVRYANWPYAMPMMVYQGKPLGATGLWVMKNNKGQHYYCASNQINGLVNMFGYCCERGPQADCNGKWCGAPNTTPLGWMFVATQ